MLTACWRRRHSLRHLNGMRVNTYCTPTPRRDCWPYDAVDVITTHMDYPCKVAPFVGEHGCLHSFNVGYGDRRRSQKLGFGGNLAYYLGFRRARDSLDGNIHLVNVPGYLKERLKWIRTHIKAYTYLRWCCDNV